LTDLPIISKSAGFVLLDVRLDDDYAAAHLPQAKNNCVFEVNFLDRMADFAPDKKTTVCVYGAAADSHEARMAAESLRARDTRKCWSCGMVSRMEVRRLSLGKRNRGEVAEPAPLTVGGKLTVPRAARNGRGAIFLISTMVRLLSGEATRFVQGELAGASWSSIWRR
jgi:rhodanese-related sulfurtransferase